MIHLEDLRTLVIRPVLTELDMHSPAAENLVLGTHLTESLIAGEVHLQQLAGGPARGIYQMEPATAIDLTRRYFHQRGDIEARVEKALWWFTPDDIDWDEVDEGVLAGRLATDLRFATALCRLRYWIVTEPLPDADDIAGLGRYWKNHYNTAGGGGTPEKFVRAWRRNVLGEVLRGS